MLYARSFLGSDQLCDTSDMRSQPSERIVSENAGVLGDRELSIRDCPMDFPVAVAPCVWEFARSVEVLE